MPLYTGSIKYTATDTTPGDTTGNTYYDDSEKELKHYDGTDWKKVNFVENYDRPGDGFYAIDSSTVFLFRSNTTNGNTTFTDASSNNISITAANGPTHSTAAYKLGTSSLFFDGSDDRFDIADNAAFDFGTGDFTIDFWQKASTASGNANWVSRRTTDGDKSNWYVRIESSSAITFAMPTASGGHAQQQFTFATGTSAWHHIAIVRSGGNTKAYANGTQIGSTVTTSYNMSEHNSDAGTTVHLGARRYNGAYTQFFNGYMDEVRISNVARWTTNFTVY